MRMQFFGYQDEKNKLKKNFKKWLENAAWKRIASSHWVYNMVKNDNNYCEQS